MSNKTQTQAPPETESSELAELDKLLGGGQQAAPLTFKDALLAAQQEGSLTDGTAEVGGDVTVINDDGKDRLIGVPMLILEYRFSPSEVAYDGAKVSVEAITAHNERVVINDGSKGIYRQCRSLEAAGKFRNIPIRSGLRRSDFRQHNGQVVRKGQEGFEEAKAAHTYYLDGSAR